MTESWAQWLGVLFVPQPRLHGKELTQIFLGWRLAFAHNQPLGEVKMLSVGMLGTLALLLSTQPLAWCSVDQAGAYVDFGGKMPLFCPLQECSIVKLQSVSSTTHSVAAKLLQIFTPEPQGCCSLIIC